MIALATPHYPFQPAVTSTLLERLYGVLMHREKATLCLYSVFCDDLDYWTHHNQPLRRYWRVTTGVPTKVRLLIQVWRFSDLP